MFMNDEGTKALYEATKDLTDAEFATDLRGRVAALNVLVEIAGKRELIINYRIKPIDNTHNANPKLSVSVMTEVA